MRPVNLLLRPATQSNNKGEGDGKSFLLSPFFFIILVADMKKQESIFIQGICTVCHKNKQTGKGNGTYRSMCSSCHIKKYATRIEYQKVKNKIKTAKKARPYLIFKKDVCECCGFKPTHLCQLDVDHIDGNHNNNALENLQTLCANCHRLKTFLNRDWEDRV